MRPTLSRMAGLPHYKMSLDPALVRLGNTVQNRYRYFRWTKRTASLTVIYVFIVPAIVGYLGYQNDGLWDLRAKRRGDIISER